MSLQTPLDAYGDLYGAGGAPTVLNRRRSRVLEILVINDLIIVLLNCGMCQVYNAGTCGRAAVNVLSMLCSLHAAKRLFYSSSSAQSR